MNNRSCVSSPADENENSYVPGYSLNYSLSESSGSLSERSSVITPRKKSEKSSKSLNDADYMTVADRCRIAIEGRGNCVSIEGHNMYKNKKR